VVGGLNRPFGRFEGSVGRLDLGDASQASSLPDDIQEHLLLLLGQHGQRGAFPKLRFVSTGVHVIALVELFLVKDLFLSVKFTLIGSSAAGVEVGEEAEVADLLQLEE
jgi:hypothetical protein